MRRIVIVGAGMAGARLAEELRRAADDNELNLTVLGAEAEQPYNRIMLSHVVAGGEGDLSSTRLKPADWWQRHSIDMRTDSTVTEINRRAHHVELTDGSTVAYDHLVLATGADAAQPPISGLTDDSGELTSGVYRLRDAADCRGLTAHLEATSGPIALVGGGFIGLEVACALAHSGRHVTVVHPRAWPMDSHLDEGAGRVLLRALADLGVQVVTGARATLWTPGNTATDQSTTGVLGLSNGGHIHANTLVLSAGTRPRTQLAASAGLAVNSGIVVDATLRTSDPAISAIGDCAERDGVVSGLVGPAWDQARVLADQLAGTDRHAQYECTTAITRLKAHGVDVVSLGEVATDLYDTAVDVTTVCEPSKGRYARVDVREGAVVGAILVGHPEPVGILTQLYEHRLPVPEDVLSVVLGRASRTAKAESPALLPDTAVLCRCNGVTKSELVSAFRAGARDTAALGARTRAGTGCGSCVSAVDGICSWLATVDPDDAGRSELVKPVVTESSEPQRECA